MKDHEEVVDAWRDDFRVAYEEDSRNVARQSFDDYWAWIQVFLVTGGAGQRGWLEQGDEVLRGVRDGAVVAGLRDRVHTIGKVIAGEWAKESLLRRIRSTLWQGSPNLYAWGGRLQRAAAEDRAMARPSAGRSTRSTPTCAPRSGGRVSRAAQAFERRRCRPRRRAAGARAPSSK